MFRLKDNDDDCSDAQILSVVTSRFITKHSLFDWQQLFLTFTNIAPPPPIKGLFLPARSPVEEHGAPKEDIYDQSLFHPIRRCCL